MQTHVKYIKSLSRTIKWLGTFPMLLNPVIEKINEWQQKLKVSNV